MQHKVKTEYGISWKKSKETEKILSLQGMGQGNIMGPVGLGILGSILFITTKASNFGASFISSITKNATINEIWPCRWCRLFQTNNNEKDLIQVAENELTLWEGDLRTAGGMIVVEKLFWYSTAFEFKKPKLVLKKNEILKGNMKMRKNEFSSLDWL